MVKASSDCKTFASDSAAAAAEEIASSAVVPLFPVVGESGCGRVVAEEEGDDGAKGGLVLALGEELGDAFEGDDPSESLDNDPEIRQRRRTFHIV